jgi:hypothetical protein
MSLFSKRTDAPVDTHPDETVLHARRSRGAARARSRKHAAGSSRPSFTALAEPYAGGPALVDRAARLVSEDPDIRAAAFAEWTAEHAGEIAEARSGLSMLEEWLDASTDRVDLTRQWDGTARTEEAGDPAD